MDAQRKMIIFTRHGVRPEINGEEQDSITLESASRVYANMGLYLQQFAQPNSLTPAQTFFKHTEKRRTLHTGNVALARAFGLPMPIPTEDFAILIPGLNVAIDPRLDYKDFKYNEEALNRDTEGYLRDMISAPDAISYKGIEVTPFNMFVEGSKGLLQDSIRKLDLRGKSLGVLSTHAGNAESIAIAALNSSRTSPIRSADDIGGIFDRENYATLILDQKGKSGLYESRLGRDGINYAVNLQNLMR